MSPKGIALCLMLLQVAAANPVTPRDTAKLWGMVALLAIGGLVMLIILIAMITMRRVYRRTFAENERAADDEASAVDPWVESARRVKVDAAEDD